jgi:hypothetical protein
MTKRWNFGWGTLRFRLIGWYVVLLVLTLVVFSVYFFFQYRDLQQAQQDTLLQGSADRLRGMVDPGRPGGGGTPDFRRGFEGGDGGPIQDLTRKNIQARLFDRNGKPVDSLGNSVSDMPQLDPVANAGAAVTVSSASSGQWRIYTQVVPFPGNVAGYVQVGQPVLVLNTEFSRLLTPILVGALLALLLAVLGGLFLANRALSPIDRVTRTAQSISTRDLSRRINYRGPAD